jgi:hypothetical protein
MKTKHRILTVACLSLAMLFTSCNKDEIDETPVLEAEPEEVVIHILETDETFTMKSLEEALFFIETEHKDAAWSKGATNKIKLLQEELEYSESLDLTRAAVEEEYTAHLEEKYSANIEYSKATSGILWDGDLTGFLSLTTVPLNLKSSKRNRASSWQCILPGTVILCDDTWFRGKKVIVVGFPPFRVLLGGAYYNFDNRTDSFF